MTLVRWCLHLRMLSSSAYDTLRRVLVLPCGCTLRDYTHYIKAGIGIQPDVTQQLLTAIKYDTLEDHHFMLHSIYKPIEEVTMMISTNSACISTVMPSVRILERMLNKQDDDDDAGIRTMKSEILTSLEWRFNYIEQIEKLCVATILDTRFKYHLFTGTEKQQLTR